MSHGRGLAWNGAWRAGGVGFTTLLAACAPEPASSVEIGQALVEVIDLARAMTLEHAIVDLTTNIAADASPTQMASSALEFAAMTVPCAEVTATGTRGVRVDFGPPTAGCALAERTFAGVAQVEFSEPGPGSRLATITYAELGSFVDPDMPGVMLDGTTQVTWGPDETRRLVSELRLSSVDERQLEIQSDRLQRTYRGALQIDGWHRWQTLMGRWQMELAGWELDRGEPVPGRGLAQVSTPFEHEVILDFVGPGDAGALVRANGGRRDRVFSVAADGAVVDLGDG